MDCSSQQGDFGGDICADDDRMAADAEDFVRTFREQAVFLPETAATEFEGVV